MKIKHLILTAIIALMPTMALADVWYPTGSSPTTLTPAVPSWGLKIPQLGTAGSPCLTVSATGVVSTKACSSGSLTGSGSPNNLTYWTSASAVGATSSPTVGYITATSTVASSTFSSGISGVNAGFYQNFAPQYAPGTASLTDVNCGGSPYTAGDTLTYRVYTQATFNGQAYFSTTYNEYSLVLAENNGCVDLTILSVQGDGDWIELSINGNTFFGAGPFTGDIEDDGSYFTNPAVHTPTAVFDWTYINYMGDQIYGLKTAGNGYFAGNLGIGISPAYPLHVKASPTDQGVVVKSSEHSSLNPSEISVLDSQGFEVLGLAAWNGGGGTSFGYGALTMSAHCTGYPCRSMEISPRDNTDRRGSILGIEDSATSEFLEFDTFNSGFTQALRISKEGYTGILNMSPAYPLDVTGAAHVTSFVDARNFVATSSSVASTFGYRVGIGTSTPYRMLSVYGSSDLGTNALAGNFTATSTATSTFASAIAIGTTTASTTFVYENTAVTNATTTMIKGSSTHPSCDTWYSPNKSAWRVYMNNSGALTTEAGVCPHN